MTQMHSTARRDAAQRARTYLMCPPEHFAVDYVINPWMNRAVPVDPVRAMSQWQQLNAVFAGLGHTVHFIDPEPGLPDMVFAANGGTVIGGKVLGARFRYPQRAAEGMAYLDWFRRSGFQSVREQASGLAAQIEATGFEPVPVDLSELRKAGGGPKCCTLELRP